MNVALEIWKVQLSFKDLYFHTLNAHRHNEPICQVMPTTKVGIRLVNLFDGYCNRAQKE